MQRLEVSGAVRLIYRSLGVKGLNTVPYQQNKLLTCGIQYKWTMTDMKCYYYFVVTNTVYCH